MGSHCWASGLRECSRSRGWWWTRGRSARRGGSLIRAGGDRGLGLGLGSSTLVNHSQPVGGVHRTDCRVFDHGNRGPRRKAMKLEPTPEKKEKKDMLVGVVCTSLEEQML